MLKGLHPLLDAALLSVLASMGHGDELAIVDRNFPAASHARRLIHLPGQPLPAVATAVFSVLPVDTYVEEPLVRMEVVENPGQVPPVQAEFLAIAERAEGRPLHLGSLPRLDFYERSRAAFAILATGEARGYGNFIISKGGV